MELLLVLLSCWSLRTNCFPLTSTNRCRHRRWEHSLLVVVALAPAELVATDGTAVVGAAAAITKGDVELAAYGYWVIAWVVCTC